MASFIPIISEILPMIMPASTRVTTADELSRAEATSDNAVIEQAAVVDQCDSMCASVLTTRPKCSSSIRHNSEQDAIIYAVSGTGVLIVKEGFDDTLKRHTIKPGGFAFIPAWTEHRIENESDVDVVWVVTKSGPRPVGAVLQDWGGDEVLEAKKA